MAMLEINHLQKKFGTTEVLRDVSLSVSKGDVVAILGPSGSGKTTLLRCVNFLERADAGELLFDDEKFDLNRASHRDIARIRQKTAFVFQNYNLFRNKTALQNVTEGLIVARKMKKRTRKRLGGSCWTRWACPTAATIILRNCPVDSSSASRLPARWRRIRKSFTSMSRHLRLTRS